MRGTFVMRGGKIVRKGGPRDIVPAVTRSDLPCPMLMSDTMDPVQHPCTGEFFSSKAKFRRVTRAHGCVEVGNDPARLRPPAKAKPDRKAIRQSLQNAVAKVAAL